jgi:hypothetical protein
MKKNTMEIDKNLLESVYECRRDIEEVDELVNENKNNLVVIVGEVRVGFRNAEVYADGSGKGKSNFDELIRKEKEKMCENEIFCKECFCGVNETALHCEIRSLKMNKKLSSLKVFVKTV